MVIIESCDPISAVEQIEGVRENQKISSQLREIADLLEEQKASEFRVQAYRAAAETIAHRQAPIRETLEQDGVPGLVALPTIGHSIANLIESALRIERMPLLDRLRGQAKAEHFFATLPGIGPHLSHRIHEHLHLETLAELKAAAADGRLAHVPGIGRKRIEAIRACLAHRTDQPTASVAANTTNEWISVDELLDIDREYRERANDDSLAKTGSVHTEKTPIVHAQRNGRHYTAMFSHTANANQQHATHDWVVVYRDDANAHGRWTIITSKFGKLKGLRIVRGREDDCQDYYRRHNAYHQPQARHAPYSELTPAWNEDERQRGVHG
ncbi:hypothetical protein K227x_04750 [Rubripirellula lacrimiformis]|uniref:Crossover junction endonuclease MUS81-like HHH domain-containing protein n=1 Tax=Rubripirellula lacrimiformis TaxID=1930273 RepID=A0A517N4P3_9BACT|nr:helix-hairpin-helix domain-containing protein [Rubripirellula lacrimiformis]QDT02104.1 hypothetical protein K227x_04750 [Rubripirellula lacrimiformis]